MHRLLPRTSWLTSLAAVAAVLTLAGACRGSAPKAAAEPVERAALAEPAPHAAPAAPAAKSTKSDLERLIELGKSDNRVQQHLDHLCNVIGPRLTSSTRLQMACEWTRDEFQRYGLTASLERWGEFPVGFDRGPWRGGMVAPEKLDFEFHTMSWTPGTDGPKRGPALAYPTSAEELEALREKIKGAWLVRPPAAELKNEAGEVVFAKPAQPARELVEAVQKAIVELGGFGEVRGSRGELLVTDGNYRISWDELPKLVSVRVRRDHHDQLWTRMQKSADAPVELEFDVDNRFVQGPIQQYNVIADLVGSQKPNEYVIVCGHLDSWDGAQGAVDNGTGCATTIEAARLLTQIGARPARTIRFILWTGEEQGLFGSEAYVKMHAAELPDISAVFNHDEGTNYLGGLSVTAQMMPAVRSATASLMTLNPEFPFELTEVEGLVNSGDSDHAPFIVAGVPAFFWKQEKGRSNYEHHHHTQYDTFDAAIPEYQEHSALVAAITALEVANLPDKLDRTNMKAPEPRRMGVQLDGAKITELTEDGRAKAAGLLAGDVVLSIDGDETKSQASVSGALRKGGSTKVVKVKRGEQTLEVTLDWSNDPDEPRRLVQIAERAARDAERDAARKAEREAKQGAEPTAAPATEGGKP